MVVITLAVDAFASLIRSEDAVMLPVAVGGFVYAVIRGAKDQNIYRVAIV